MKYLIAISGPVASGKSVLANEILRRFKTHRISTRQVLVDMGAPNERKAVIEAGKRLDRETDGTWVRDGSLPHLRENERAFDVVLIDAVRTARQIHHLREMFGEKFFHIHLSVLSTPLQKAIGWPERKYINDAGEKAANWGPFRQASGLDGIICRRVRADTA